VGVLGPKRPTRFHLELSTYDWFGLHRTGRNGFDSRYILDLIRIACVSTSRFNDSVFAGLFIALVGKASKMWQLDFDGEI
jgi:hypothetical protein